MAKRRTRKSNSASSLTHFMSIYWRELVLLLFMVLIISPVLIRLDLLYLGTPDLQYVKAKALRVATGDIFIDPVSGYPTFHPPLYHIFLAFWVKLGIPIDTILLILSLLNHCWLILLTYLIIRRVFNPDIAFFTALFIPFILCFMDRGYGFLASSFRFSLPFYLFGLWIYLKARRTLKDNIIIGILWGITFQISPVYLFIIGFIFLFELFTKKALKNVYGLIGSFGVAIIPFVIQMYVVFAADMAGSTTFAIWRGIPSLNWWREFAAYFIFPLHKDFKSLHVIPPLLITTIGIIALWRFRKVNSFPFIALVATIFTAYHFSHQYAVRIKFFFSIFLIAFTINLLLKIKLQKTLSYFLIFIFIALGILDHFRQIEHVYSMRARNYDNYIRTGSQLWENIDSFIEAKKFILATEDTYRYFIMPFAPAQGLLAYRTGEYFQLKPKVADQMVRDYMRILDSQNIKEIEKLCNKYDINTTVMHNDELAIIPGFKNIAENWSLVYRDDYFYIFKRPDSGR